jgi:hypothetical protein
MKRVVQFRDQETEKEFKEIQPENRKRKKEKFNSDSKKKKLSNVEYKQKKKEMLEFRKQLPIYSGKVDFPNLH